MSLAPSSTHPNGVQVLSKNLRSSSAQLIRGCVFSGVIEFLSAGRVPSEHRDFKELGYASSLRRMPGSEHEFTHNFKLASAYSEDIMPYTNYT